jgi:ribonuclease E
VATDQSSESELPQAAPPEPTEVAPQQAATKEPDPRPRIGDTRPAPAQIGDTRPAPAASEATKKIRVHELANELGLTNKEALDLAIALGIGVKTHSSSIEEAQADLVRRKADSEGLRRDVQPEDAEPKKPQQQRQRQPKTEKPIAPKVVEATVEPRGSEEGESSAKRSRNRRRGGRSKQGRSTGRYLMCVHVQPNATHIAMLEGRSLVEHFVARPADATNQIDGNIYRGRVQNVLPGMEAAFVDIGIPKNAVLYRGDVHLGDETDEAETTSQPRIEEMLKAGQMLLCQVTKNPIGAKGARLTQEVSLPGRFAVLVPNSSAAGISKRLGDNERRRLRKIIDAVKPAQHGIIVRTAAEGVSEEDLRRDIASLVGRWEAIDAEAKRSNQPGLVYREPDMALKMLREELNDDYRGVLIDDFEVYNQVRDYVAAVNPELADRVEYYDTSVETLPLFERYFVHEQLHKALDRKVWLPSGGSLIIERTEALTVIDVNTGKNVGKTNLEETVYRNNLEAAEEVARQLRLRDIGGIIVIDFIDMETKDNRDKVAAALRAALGREKTRTQVFDISELGLVEMTRKRVSEGLIESLTTSCSVCEGRGFLVDQDAL